MLGAFELSEVAHLVRRIGVLEDTISVYLTKHRNEKALDAATISSIPIEIWDTPSHFAILLSFFAERVCCIMSVQSGFFVDNVLAVLRRWMQVSQIEQADEETLVSVTSLEQSSYMAANDLSQRDIKTLAEKLGEGSSGFAGSLSGQEKQHLYSLYMTLTDDKLGRTSTGRIV